ncbi:MAG TPA: hypothetical protein DCY51_01255 [Bacteroidetes bacterium]|nr:hypothetical protein [Bacteroidota bacterium]
MPLPLIPLALSALPGIIQQQTDKKRLNQDFNRVNDRLDKLGGQEKGLLADRQYGVGDSWNKFLAASKQDKAADMQRQIASEQEASTLGALKSGGAKALLGGLGAAQRRSAQQRMGIEADSQARQQSALQQYAGVENRANDLNVGLANQDLLRVQGQMDESKIEKELLRGEKRAAKDDRISGYMNLASQFLGKNGAKVPEYKDGGSAFGNFLLGEKGNRGGLMKDGFQEGVEESKKNTRYTSIRSKTGGYKTDLQDASNPISQDDVNEALAGSKATQDERDATSETNRALLGENFNFEGGLNATRKRVEEKRNGGVQKTPGKFSHAKNPIDIMKDGSKIGEMTGGEYIFNPRQASTLQSLSSKGGSPLHKYVKGLLKEFDTRK